MKAERTPGPRFFVVVWHGEIGTLFCVVDRHAASDPTVVATTHSRSMAEETAERLNAYKARAAIARATGGKVR